ncbi:MAG TPA: hypothetical protein VGF30_11065, partial [Bacteroidia bacterium]
LKLIGTIIPYNSWTHNSGIIESSQAHVIYGSSLFFTITGSHTLSNAEFQMYGVIGITISSGTELTVLDSLVFSTGTSVGGTLINTGVINLKGNLYINSTSTGNSGTATLKINGTTDQGIYGSTISGTNGRLPNTEINKSSGTLYLYDKICIGTSSATTTLTHTAGTVNYGTSNFVFLNNCNIISSTSGNKLNLYDVTFATGTISINASTTLVVNGDFSTTSASGSALIINNGTIECKGDVTYANTSTSTSGGGTGTILINGTGNQTLTGSGIAGAGYLPKVNIDKPSGTLYLASITSMNNDWTYTAGTVDASTYNSTVYVRGSKNIDGQGTSSTMSFHNLTVNSGTVTATGDLKVSNNLTINSSTTLAQGSYGLSFGGYANNGTHTSSGAVSFVGNGYHTFSKSGGGTTSFANVTINRTGGSLMLASPLNVTTALTLNKGILKTTPTNLLTFPDNATCSGGSDSGYVHGPVKKTGDDAFTFPLGDTALTIQAYHPLVITAPTYTTDVFSAEYKYTPQTYGTKTVDTVESVSNEEYYLLTRNAGSSNIKASLSWRDPQSNYITSEDCVLVVSVNPSDSVWHDLGGSARVTSGSLLSVTSLLDIPFSGTTARLIALGKKGSLITYAKPERFLDGGYYQAIKNKLYFKFDNDYAENNRGLKFNIYDKTNTVIASNDGLSASPYPLKYKDNRYVLNLPALSSSITNGYFILEVFDKKDEKYFLRFKN